MSREVKFNLPGYEQYDGNGTFYIAKLAHPAVKTQSIALSFIEALAQDAEPSFIPVGQTKELTPDPYDPSQLNRQALSIIAKGLLGARHWGIFWESPLNGIYPEGYARFSPYGPLTRPLGIKTEIGFSGSNMEDRTRMLAALFTIATSRYLPNIPLIADVVKGGSTQEMLGELHFTQEREVQPLRLGKYQVPRVRLVSLAVAGLREALKSDMPFLKDTSEPDPWIFNNQPAIRHRVK